jgi:hypothetical protein
MRNSLRKNKTSRLSKVKKTVINSKKKQHVLPNLVRNLDTLKMFRHFLLRY